jgi:hypothetical protein
MAFLAWTDRSKDVSVPTSLRQDIEKCIMSIDGVTLSPSGFGDVDAYWVNGKEIAHFDDPTTVDLRLTRAGISARRPELKADPRVTLRRSGSDWVEVRVATKDDLAWLTSLVEAAADAHRAPEGSTPKSPPVGAELDRRRRFH